MSVGLSILVFAKQVPDTQNITGDAMKEDGTVNRAALPAIINPEDLNGIEMALELRERYGGKVTVCTMGPPAAANILRYAMYMGADETILLTDRKFAGADTLATSYTLACAARKAGDFDVVICGRQAIDGDTAQVGPQLAEKLQIPQITYVSKVEDLTRKTLRVRRLIEDGYEILETPIPVLLTTVGNANTPRPAGAKRLMMYKKAMTSSELRAKHGASDYEDANILAEEEEKLRSQGRWIHEWGVEDIEADEQRVGMAGSPTKVKNIESVVLTGKDSTKSIDPTDQGIKNMMHELIEEHILS